jgi:peptidyl-prolyl cis-trans isomerase A (cyclophilin A)
MTRRTLMILAATTLFAASFPLSARAAAPETYKVKFETTAGDFTIEVTRRLAPLGADRFHELVESKFFDGARFFRVVPDFVVQFGITGDPEVQKKWRDARIQDDEVKVSNKKGTIVFATSGKNSRTTQLFVNLKDNGRLDALGFAPFGRVVEGMESVEKITSKYGEEPDQGEIQSRGNEYLTKVFPDLDYIEKATIVKDE